jgi:hypothetical protein
MPGCVLRVFGVNFDVDGCLASSPFEPCAVFRRGQPRVQGLARTSESSGFNLDISANSGGKLSVQVQEAAIFVASQRLELGRVVAWPGVESVTLDFGWDFPLERVAGQYNYFPPALLADCGALGIGIEVSVYAVSGENEKTNVDTP